MTRGLSALMAASVNLGLLAVLGVVGCAESAFPDSPPRDDESDESDETDGTECTDVPPDELFNCGEQVGWDKCSEPFMDDFCNRSCGRCPGIGNSSETCSNTSPDDRFTCEEQAEWGKCDEPFMDGFCDRACNRCAVNTQLIDPNATAKTRALMTYLASAYRNSVLSGQQTRADADHIASLTGRYPAIVGFDLMDYSPSRVERGAAATEIEQALEWAKSKGGIVTFSWHWNAPTDLIDSEEWPWWRGFYTEATNFDFRAAMDDRDSPERALLLRDIDQIAIQIQRLNEENVPVLWRPIHEASGAWFWWGAHGSKPYMALWRLLYDRLVNHHQLHNLIWVWNGQDPAWYPGDAYVDIVAEDIYDGEHNHAPQQQRYLEATQYTQMSKMVALSETGALLDPSDLQASAARWSWFMLWSGHFATDESWNDDSMKQKVYDSEFVITLDELPSL